VLWRARNHNEFGRTLAKRTEAQTDRIGRICGNAAMTIPNFPNIFVVGDLGWLTIRKLTTSRVAQVAMQAAPTQRSESPRVEKKPIRRRSTISIRATWR